MKISKNKSGNWVIDFTCRGHRINRIIGMSKRQAEAEAVRVKAEILAGRFIPVKEKGKRQTDGSFAAHADEFLELHSKQHKRSWRRDEVSIAHLKDFFGDKALTDITAQQIEKYMLKRKADRDGRIKEPTNESPTVSQTSINRELSCLKTMLEKAVEWGKIKENPAKRTKKFREAPLKERILSTDEAQRLIDAASPGIRPILIIALNTGMRRGEILNLRWASADLLKGYILIEDSKSGRSRKIPMNGPVLDVLATRKQEGEFVFDVKDIKTAFRGSCDRAGIKELRFHDLRHTAASWMVEDGIDLVTVSKILGHSSIQMTMRYAHPTPENMRVAVNKLSKHLEQGRAKVESIKVGRPASASNHDN